jgi:hypothetical protein
MRKILIIAIIISLFGIATADKYIDNASPINVGNFIAGNSVRINFSYDFFRDRPQNPDNSPLILNIKFQSESEYYPVWREDFKVSGYIDRYLFWGLIKVKTEHFECNDDEIQTIKHPLGIEIIENIPNGTFFCFDKDGKLDFSNFNAHDKVYLDVTSKPNIWPGQYNITAKMLYMTDDHPPIIIIKNKTYFEQYFRDGSYVEFQAEILDINLEDYNAKILANQNISFSKEISDKNTYRFFQVLPYDIPEGYFDLIIWAKDAFGNSAYNKTKIKIDRTPPELSLISPLNTSIIGELLIINVSAQDEKSGLNESSIAYKLREMNGNNICPEYGIGSWNCYNSGWININKGDLGFYVAVNTTKFELKSGEYWLEIKACDILNNCRTL